MQKTPPIHQYPRQRQTTNHMYGAGKQCANGGRSVDKQETSLEVDADQL